MYNIDSIVAGVAPFNLLFQVEIVWLYGQYKAARGEPSHTVQFSFCYPYIHIQLISPNEQYIWKSTPDRFTYTRKRCIATLTIKHRTRNHTHALPFFGSY